LYVDDYVWSRDNWQWHSTKRKEVHLTLHNGEPDALFVDGVKVPMKKGSKRYLLAIALITNAHRDGSITLQKLANDVHIWGGRISATNAKRRVHSLNSTMLPDLLIIADDRVELNANVTIG
jgi:hypothetical protein